MNNEEIKQMIRELSESADAEGRVKSRTVRISLQPEGSRERTGRGGLLSRLGGRSKEETEEEVSVSEGLSDEAGASEQLPESEHEQTFDELQDAAAQEDYLDEEAEDLTENEDEMASFSVLPSDRHETVRRFHRASAVNDQAEETGDHQVKQVDDWPETEGEQPVADGPGGSDAQEDLHLPSEEVIDGEEVQEQEDLPAREPFRISSALSDIRARLAVLAEERKEKTAVRKAEKKSRAERKAAEKAAAAQSKEPDDGWLDEEDDELSEERETGGEASDMSEASVNEMGAVETETSPETEQVPERSEKAAAGVDTAEAGKPAAVEAPADAGTADPETSASRSTEEAEPDETEVASERAEDVRQPDSADASSGEAGNEAPQEEPTQPRPKPKKWSVVWKNTPMEEADFSSDADLFRNGAESGTEEAEDPFVRIRIWMQAHEIGKRHVIVLAAVLAVLIAGLIIGYAVRSARQKTANVTADEGLKVTVEKQPSEWTTSAAVTLGIRTSAAIQSITVNGTTSAFSGTNSTQIQVEAQTEQLEVMVVSEESVLNAVIDLPKIDVTAPTVSFSESDGLVTIDALDERSGIQAVYYGKYVGLSTVPAYELYTEPFTPEEGALYACYAVDRAGNVTGPITTDMTEASALILSEETMALFPGDTARLTVGTVPANAFLNGLQISSSNPNVASVSSAGVITAKAEGTAEITASADGLNDVTCTVKVRSQASVTISAVGDCTLGDDVNFSSVNSFSTVYSLMGSSYFLENVRSIFEEDDITFANMEGTLTDQGTRADKTYAFRGDPSYVDILTEGSVEVVTLANNHSSDYGEISLTDTEQYLTEAGIDYVIGDTVVVREAAGVKVGMIGIYTLDSTTTEAKLLLQQDIDAVRKQDADVIVVAFHWGEEKATSPGDDQISLAHAAVDYGADLVVGHHPHVLQGIELYEGKYIVYSLGNFCFGGNSNPDDKDTMIFQETFTLQRSGGVESTSVKVIPCSISSDSASNNYQPTPAVGSEAERIIEKINERSAQFGTEAFTYDGE